MLILERKKKKVKALFSPYCNAVFSLHLTYIFSPTEISQQIAFKSNPNLKYQAYFLILKNNSNLLFRI